MRLRKPQLITGNTGELQSGTVILGFQLETFGTIRMEMDTLAVVNLENFPCSSASVVRSIKTVGTLDLNQQYPIANTP